ncbi:MAG: YczE/YyaS/YitT family protein [Ilumatobacteraceae bacterium]
MAGGFEVPRLPWRERLAERLVRCIAGLAVFGVGISLQMEAGLGSPPWDVFHQGVSARTGVSVGRVIILTGACLMLLWIPLRQRPGLGTVLNAIVIGLVADVVLGALETPASLAVRIAMMVVGILVTGFGTGLYIGSALGPGPRDGLMTGIAARGPSIRLARTAIEVTVLLIGWRLGGTLGIGTLLFALSIGPVAQYFLPRLAMRPRVGAAAR